MIMTKKTIKDEIILKSATQDNDLVRAKYKYSTREIKLARLLVSKINPFDEKNNDRIYLTADEIIAFLTPNSSNKYGSIYGDIKKIIKSLNSKPIEGMTKKEKFSTVWVHTHGMDLNTREYWFELTPRIRILLMALKKGFSTIPLYVYDRLKSAYLMRLLEVLYSYRNMRGGKIKYEKWQELRDQIGASHKNYGHFKNRILIPAFDTLPQKTPLRFEFEEIKAMKSRRVVGLIFTIYMHKPFETPKKEKITNVLTLFETEDKKPTDDQQQLAKDIEETLQGWGIPITKINEILDNPFTLIANEKAREGAKRNYKNRLDYIWSKIQYTINVQNIRTSEAAYFLSAIIQNYETKVEKKQLKNEVIKKIAEQRQYELQQLEADRNTITDKYYELEKEIVQGVFKEHPNLKKELIQKAKERALSGYNIKKTDEENYNAKTLFYCRVVGLLKNRFPKKFEPIEIEKEDKLKIFAQKEMEIKTRKM